MLLKDRVAIVTGAANGIGAGIALKFAEEGCSVVVVDIAEAEGQKIADEVKKKGREGIFIRCDVTDYAQVQEMVRQTISKFGKIDILVNNAGGDLGMAVKFIDKVTIEQWDKVVDLNLKSQFLCCKEVVPHMRERKYGKIINFSSLGAIAPTVSLTPYHAAKGGVIGLTTNLAAELATHNITVNAIMPGPTKTSWIPFPEGGPEFETKEERAAYFYKQEAKMIPMKRMGTPEDLAGAALFLASDLSAFVTGVSLPVGGGVPLPAAPESKD
jgi:NAD(P)-dependent dehydrogenase (short-subunit alcohol dehydrogenase family)